jgi:hypothetical protein
MIRRALAFAVLTAALANCQSIVSRPGIQCSSTAECRALGGPFATSRCSNEGTCEPIVAPDAGSSVGSACATTADCRARITEGARCVEGQCRPLALADNSCSLAGPVEDDDAVLLGALIPRGGVAGAEFGRAKDAIGWAVSEWNSRARAERARKVAVVACDESNIAASLPHLLALRPRAFIGPFTNTRLREYIKTVEATETPTFAPAVDDPILVDQPDSRRRLYGCTPNLSAATKPFARAAKVLADRLGSEPGKARVLLVRTADPSETALVAELEKTASGLTLAAPTITLNFDLHGSSSSLLAQASAIAFEKPELVVLTSPGPSEELIGSIDLRWPTINPNLPRPVFLIMNRWTKIEESFKATQKATNGRFFALDWGTDDRAQSNYNVYAAEMIAREAPAGLAGARAVDCTYVALLGLFAGATKASASMLSVTPQQIVDGVALATGGGEQVKVLPDDIPRAIGLLGATPQLATKLLGASTPGLVFQPNGTMQGTATLYCISSETAPTARTWTPTGMTFGASGEENGSIACP